MSKYGKEYDVYIINVCGEWDKYADKIKKNSVKIIDLKYKYFKFLPKTGFIGSRISYIIIFILSFFPLLLLLKAHKPKLLVLHLITSLPLILLNCFTFETKFMLRISGYPKLNYMRKFLWKKISKKLQLVSCPTLDLKNELTETYIFNKDKIYYLPDAILNYDTFKQKHKNSPFLEKFYEKKIILSVGRLTKQKNFSYLISEFNKFSKINNDYILYILGKGEEKKNLEELIGKLELKDKVFLGGYRNDVNACMKKSEIFILSSLWEEVGFVMVEAAMNNLYIISSDCPNGPVEFLNLGKNGILFKSNIQDEIFKSLLIYSKMNEKKKFNDKVALKKNALKYTKFQHYLKFNRILNKILN